jgi:hypothetical protein
MKIIESSDQKHLGKEVTFFPGVTQEITFANGYVMEIEKYIQLSSRIFKVSNRNYTIILEDKN